MAIRFHCQRPRRLCGRANVKWWEYLHPIRCRSRREHVPKIMMNNAVPYPPCVHAPIYRLLRFTYSKNLFGPAVH